MRFSEKSAATAFLSAASGRNTILCPLIIEAGAKSSALIVSLVYHLRKTGGHVIDLLIVVFQPFDILFGKFDDFIEFFQIAAIGFDKGLVSFNHGLSSS